MHKARNFRISSEWCGAWVRSWRMDVPHRGLSADVGPAAAHPGRGSKVGKRPCEALPQMFWVQRPSRPCPIAVGACRHGLLPWLGLPTSAQISAHLVLLVSPRGDLACLCSLLLFNRQLPWFTFGPMMAGVTMAAVTGGFAHVKSLLAATFRWKVNPIWYVAAIALPFATQYLSVLLNPLCGSAAPAGATFRLSWKSFRWWPSIVFAAQR